VRAVLTFLTINYCICLIRNIFPIDIHGGVLQDGQLIVQRHELRVCVTHEVINTLLIGPLSTYFPVFSSFFSESSAIIPRAPPSAT
jgi:hypothetical protein